MNGRQKGDVVVMVEEVRVMVPWVEMFVLSSIHKTRIDHGRRSATHFFLVGRQWFGLPSNKAQS